MAKKLPKYGIKFKIPAEIPKCHRIAQANDLKEDDEHNGDDNGYRNLPSNVVGELGIDI